MVEVGCLKSALLQNMEARMEIMKIIKVVRYIINRIEQLGVLVIINRYKITWILHQILANSNKMILTAGYYNETPHRFPLMTLSHPFPLPWRNVLTNN